MILTQVKFLDLTLPQYWLDTYDWVMCLEVLEHLPASHEHIAVDNIVRAARTGIVLSWAVPGQLGFHHINLRSHEYVTNLTKYKGFDVDLEATDKLKNATGLIWLRNNLFVVRRRSQDKSCS